MPRIKRKYASTRPTLGQGIPELKRLILETGPSIPRDEEHAKVDFVVKEFGLLGPETFREIENFPTDLQVINGQITYVTENDIALAVRSYVSSIVDALGLSGEISVYTEIGVFKLRPDLWVITLLAMPIGVIEVKKPDILPSESALNHPNVLGELYDFMKHLPNFYGVSPAFGIVTNLNSWRIAWFPDDEADAVAAQIEEVEEDGEELIPTVGSDSLDSIASHQIDDDRAEEDDNVECAADEDLSDRRLHVSRIYHKTEEKNVSVKAIGSAILKMSKAKRRPYSDPFEDLDKRSLLKFEKGDNASAFWTRLTLKDGPQWNKVANPSRWLFAIQDLGYGAHGRVWLTCSSSGAVCVLKFSLDGRAPSLDKEYVVWEKAYSPQFKVYREYWCGEPALRMPHFAKVAGANQKDFVPLVEATLMASFHSRGLVHQDVSWRNVGQYTEKTGTTKAVVFDMGNIRDLRNGESNEWVVEACRRLGDTNESVNTTSYLGTTTTLST